MSEIITLKTINMSKIKVINEFFNYVTDFYNDKDGIYPIASKKQIKEACIEFINTRITEQKVLHFDSFDREEVRCIIEPSHKIFL